MLRLRKIQVNWKGNSLNLVIHNFNYEYLLIAEEEKLRLHTGLEPYKYNDTVYHPTQQQIDEMKWLKIFPIKVHEKLNIDNFNPSDLFIDQDQKTFYRKEDIVFPVFNFTLNSQIKEYGNFPRLHSSIMCNSSNILFGNKFVNRHPIRFTNHRIHDIIDRETKDVYQKVKLKYCRTCEPDAKAGYLSNFRLSFDLSDILN